MTTMRDGREVADPRLDRIPQYDERSRNFQVRRLLEERRPDLEAARRKPKAWRPGPSILNQRNYGACVWFSAATILNASPHRRNPPLTEDQARGYYFETQRRDEFPGGEYPGASPVAGGTSLLAGAKLAKELGFIDSFWWCGAGSQTAIDDVIDTQAAIGSVWFGVPWYDSMFNPKPGGALVVDPSSGLAGYHAIGSLAFRYAPIPGEGPKKIEHLVWPNTWGPSWAGQWFKLGGHCFVKVEDVEAHLLPRDVYGEAAVLVESGT